ncbi:hypothetical protein NDU88_003001 [Pleurodeles waltl]|uniref:Uncharacterized protein n=1 Tax=Pleurodeles waltl TaxID=8319 RepID=A0AAV7SER7_PLEWA|nr:hypothetical protein NDU88_003001 [Pleurodeles waltl]
MRHWARKITEAQLAMASQRGRGARRTLTPLMARILAVACPELDGRLRESQQPQGASLGLHWGSRLEWWYPVSGCVSVGPLGQARHSSVASSGGEAEAPETEGAATHRTQEAESTNAEGLTRRVRGAPQQRLKLRWELPGGGGLFCDHPSYRRLHSPSLSSPALVFVVEHDVGDHRKDLEFWFHGGVVLTFVSNWWVL